jgi:uncharacterized protein YdaU (DUF1376 family)
MGKDPAFLFYPGDWNLGTMHMTLLEKGAYIELLMLQFARDKFTLTHAKHMLKDDFDKVWPTLVEKFKSDGKNYWNERLLMEKTNRVKFSESRRNNALSNRKRDGMLETHMSHHKENEVKNEKVDEYNKEDVVKFKIPSVEEIRIYCLERKNKVSPEKFFDFYKSKDWFIGKNRMADWRAAIRTWENQSNSNLQLPSGTHTGQVIVSGKIKPY